MKFGRRVLFVLALSASCLPAQPEPKPFKLGLIPVRVAAAVSLKEALLDFENYYESDHREVDIQYTFAGSQFLANMILENEVFDVFISADSIQMDRARESKRLEEPRVFAKTTLAIVAPVGNDKVQTPNDLGKEGIYVVMAAESVPIGNYARMALRKLGILSGVLDNVHSSEQSTRQVLIKVLSGDVDAGIVYSTDVTPAVKDKLRVIPFTGAEEIVPVYQLAVFNDSKVREATDGVVKSLCGIYGGEALERAGFMLP
jgi:molybdate transport system substrate-binding protein